MYGARLQISPLVDFEHHRVIVKRAIGSLRIAVRRVYTNLIAAVHEVVDSHLYRSLERL